MNKICLNLMGFIIALLGLACSSNVHAEATRTWVSGVGDDANPCSRTAPCKTFAGAISKTAAGGEISVLDPGGFGSVTITKSITINGGGGAGFGSILNAGTNGVVISALTTDEVILRNLSINGAGTGLIGVKIMAAGTVSIENSQIFGNLQNGISDQRTGSGKLFIDNTLVRNNSESGIQIQNATKAALRGVQLIANGNAGLFMNVGSNVVLLNSLLSGNTNGVHVEAPSGTTNLFVADSTMSGNGTGLDVGSGNPFIQLANNIITANNVGVSPGTVAIISYGSNKISGNTSGNGPFSPPFIRMDKDKQNITPIMMLMLD